MRRLAVVLGVLAGGAQAEAWEPMSGAQITGTLTGQVVQYESAWQNFRASGRTLYNAGKDSWGYWAVREAQYCSMWPPSDLWACYDMDRAGDKVRFRDSTGDVTVGVLTGSIEK